MNAKQEILEIIDYTRRQKDMPLAGSEVDRIREILSKHTLEPIGDGTPLAQECANLIEEAERRAKENGRGDVAYRNAIHRLKQFLKDRKTSFFAGKEKIDDREFSPAILGWLVLHNLKDDEVKRVEWESRNGNYKIMKNSRYSLTTGRLLGRLEMTTSGAAVYGVITEFPWPSTQSDGEKLLRLLGVEI